MIPSGQRRVETLGNLRVLLCHCDHAELNLPLPKPSFLKGSFCQLCLVPVPLKKK